MYRPHNSRMDGEALLRETIPRTSNFECSASQAWRQTGKLVERSIRLRLRVPRRIRSPVPGTTGRSSTQPRSHYCGKTSGPQLKRPDQSSVDSVGQSPNIALSKQQISALNLYGKQRPDGRLMSVDAKDAKQHRGRKYFRRSTVLTVCPARLHRKLGRKLPSVLASIPVPGPRCGVRFHPYKSG